jgi:hypothetical protein
MHNPRTRRLSGAWSLGALTLLSLAVLAGCGESAPADDANSATQQELTTAPEEGMMPTTRTSALKKIFHAVPSPIETALLLEASGVNFSTDDLNDAGKASGYQTTGLQAVNLGIYAGDLSYATIFNRNQEAIQYLNVARRLADELGVGDLIDGALIERAEDNREVRDSLIHIVTSTFYALNARLKENGMEDVSGLIAAGGWIEGVYLGTRNLDGATEELKTRIAEQKLTLDNLRSLLASYPSTEDLAGMIAELDAVETAFAGVEIVEHAANTSTTDDGLVVISGGPEISVSDETLAAIAEAVAGVRNHYAN